MEISDIDYVNLRSILWYVLCKLTH